MKARIFLASFILVLALVACTTAAPQAETVTVRETVEIEVPVTVVSEVEVPVEVTRLVEVEVTRLVEVEVTAAPTETPTPAPTEEAAGGRIAHNYVAEVENGGLTVQIARVLVAEKSAIPLDFSRDPSFDTADVVGELIFIVTNTGDKAVNLYPFQGTVQINGEVIELFDYFLTHFGDDIGSDIPPGAELIGGQWFGIKRNALADITGMTVRFDGPFDAESFDRLGPDFEIVIDLSDGIFEPIPEELEDALD